MLRRIVGLSLRHRPLVIAAAALLLVAGVPVARRAPIDVFPEFAPPLVEVQTEAPGLSTEEVESFVTVPLEGALNGIPYLQTMRSKSVLGLSSIVFIFEDGTDPIRARQVVQERVQAEAARLPARAGAPAILPPVSSQSRVLKIGLSSKKISRTELTALARFKIRPRLMAVPGVANVAIWGARDRELEVVVDPDRLRARAIPLEAVLRAARDAVALDGGGFVDTPNQRLAVRHVSAVVGPEDLARTVVAFRDGAPVRLGEVTDVAAGSPPLIGDAVIGDGPGLLLVIEKQPWANTLAVTRAIDEALDALRPVLADVAVDRTIFRPATFIERSIGNLARALVLGCALVVAVLFAFLQGVRTALVSLVAIPLSLLGAVVVLAARGATLDTLALAGLAIAVGEVVDDAIIDVENIVRRLRQNHEEGSPRTPFRVVLRASLEVRSAVVYASLIVVLVFVPVFFLEGVAGAFFRPLATAYVLAIGSSLLVALTVTPALALAVFPADGGRRGDAPLVRVLKSVYGRALPPLVRRPRLATVVIGGALVLAAAGAAGLGQEFLPDFAESDFLVHWIEKPGTSIEASARAATLVSREIRSIPGVRSVGAHIGRAEAADEVVGPNFTELWIGVDPAADRARTVERLNEVVAGYPGATRDVFTYLKERIQEVLTGAGATVVVRIYGPDLATLRAKADGVARALASIAGVRDVAVEAQALVPQIEVRLRPDVAARFGANPGDVRRTASVLIRGESVGAVFHGERAVGVTVRGVAHARGDVATLRRLPVETPGGGTVALGELASVTVVPAPNEILREGSSRRIDVTCNVTGGDVGAVAGVVRAAVGAVPFDREYHAEVLGEYAAQEAARTRLLALAGVALLGILLVLRVDFGSFRLALLVFFTLPFALMGGVAAAWLGGGVLSLGSIVGFVTVLGIAARNGIMLVSHYRHLERSEGEAFGEALVLRGSRERLAPILMTALSAGLALLPIVARGNVPGHEIERPMALVILGGLVTSTALSLLLLPALYLAVARPGAAAGERP